MTVTLFWDDFYEQMEKMNMEDDYDGFTKILVDMFKKQFNVKKVKIEWTD